MTLPELKLETNKNLKSVKTVTVRQSEKGSVLTAYLVDVDHTPLDLTGKFVTFMDKKANEKWISDDKVKIIDARNGHIEYTLHDQAYAGSGTAWFEINDADGKKIDSTQDFYITVDEGMSVSVYNTNYIYKMEKMRNQLQSIIDNADSALKNELQKATNNLGSKLKTLQATYEASDKQWHDAFDKSEKERADDYTAEKNKRLANDQQNATDFANAQKQRSDDYDAEKTKRSQTDKNQAAAFDKAQSDRADTFTAAQNKRDSDFATQQDTINKAASDQRDTIDQQWADEQSTLVKDWMTKRDSMDAELTKLEATVNALQTTVDQLNKADLPNAKQKMADLEAEIKKAEQSFSQVDFSKFVTGTQFKQVTDTLATKADKTEVDTKLTDYYDKTAVDSKLADKANAADVYTKTELDPKLAEAGKVKTVSLNGGDKVAPDDAGNIDLTVPKPDLSPYAKTVDVNSQFDTVDAQIKALQKNNGSFTPITQAAYNKLTDDEKLHGMYAIVGDDTSGT